MSDAEPPGAERRRFPRFSVRLKVQIGEDEPREFISENISLGGLFLSTEEEVGHVGDEIRVHLKLPDDGEVSGDVTIGALVRHAIPPIGYGIEFQVGRDDEEFQKLSRYLVHLEQIKAQLA